MKATNKWTHAECDEIIRENKDNTNYFNRKCSQYEIWEMLRYQMHLGESESAVIIAALIKAGAKFRMEDEQWKGMS